MIASWAPGFPGNGHPAEGLPRPGPGQRLAPLLPRAGGFQSGGVRKGLEWFLAHTECPGCRNGRGLDDCPIRVCAQGRQIEPLLPMPGPGALRQVRPAPGAVSRRQDQPAPPPVEVQGEGISPEAGRGEEVRGKSRAKRGKGEKVRLTGGKDTQEFQPRVSMAYYCLGTRK